MTMKKGLIALPALAILTLSSCSNEPDAPGAANPANEIRVATEVSPLNSRAGYTTEQLREFGLIIASGNEAYTYNNKRMAGGPLEGWLTDVTMYWENRNNPHTVIAYAPYRDAVLDKESKIDVKVSTDQSTAEAVTASDFIAMKRDGFIPANDLVDGQLLVKMDHMFSKIFIKLNYPEAYATSDATVNPVTDLKVQGMKVDATLDFAAWDGSQSSAAIALNGNGAAEEITPFVLNHDAASRQVVYEFIAVPQEQASIGVSFIAGGIPYTWKYDNLKLHSGESVTINLSVDKQGVSLGGDVTVGEWTSGEEINGGNPSEGAQPYVIEEVTTEKSEWTIEYATASMPFGTLSQMIDNNLDSGQGWFSQVVDGYNNSPNTGKPFAVIDFGKNVWLAEVGILTSFHDVMPKAVDFYVTRQSLIENVITTGELNQVLCLAEPNGDGWVNSEDYRNYLDKIKTADAEIDWIHVGRVEIPALSPEYGQKEYRVEFDDEKLAQELKGRYLKVEMTFFSPEEHQVLGGDRAKIAELLVKRVAKHNGEVVE